MFKKGFYEGYYKGSYKGFRVDGLRLQGIGLLGLWVHGSRFRMGLGEVVRVSGLGVGSGRVSGCLVGGIWIGRLSLGLL